MANQTNDVVKKGYSKDRYNADRELELARCLEDPIYFIEKYIKVRHPTKGRLPLILREYQKVFIRAYHEHKDVVGLAGRQLGKCVVADTKVSKDGKQVEIGSLLRLSFRERIVYHLEKWLFQLSK